jgi:hypothetical protein
LNAGNSLSSETLSFDAGVSAVDLTGCPFLALFLRLAGRRADFVKDDVIGPRLAVRIDRMLSLPIVERTRPPHGK